MSNEDFNATSSNANSGGTFSDINDGLPGSGDITETSSKSWLERILDSLKAIVFGLILVIASSVLMFWNEGRAAKTAAALNEGAGQVVAVAANRVDPVNEGKLVHVAGDSAAAQAARDPDFGFDAKGLKLTRKVELYQWKEDKNTETQKKLGGGEETITRYSYSREWSDKAIDSSRFRNTADHRNPAMPGVASRSFNAPDAKLGAFALGDRILALLHAEEKFEAPASAQAQAQARLGPRTRVSQGGVYAGANPDQPVVGDIRVSWTFVPLAQVSVAARQTQSTFSPWLSSNGREILLAETGVKDAALLFKHGQDENRLVTWILRVVGMVLMFLGFAMMFSLLSVIADIGPFIGNVVGAGTGLVALLFTLILAPIIIAFAWFFYRPFVAGGVILVGAALVWGWRELMKQRVAGRAPAFAQAGSFLPGAAPQAQATSFLQGGSPLIPK